MVFLLGFTMLSTAPLSMPRRLLIDDAAWWEALVSAGTIAATTAAPVVLASRLYRGSLLRTGSPPSGRRGRPASGGEPRQAAH